MKNKKVLLYSLFFVVLAIAWTVYSNVIVNNENKDFIEGSGIVEGDSVIVSSKLPGQLEEIVIDEGHLVDEGQLIARLSSERIEAKVMQAEAQLEIAKAQVESAEAAMKALGITVDQRELAVNLSREEVKSNIKLAQSALETAKSNHKQLTIIYNDAERDYERYLILYENGAISQQQLEKAKLNYDTVKSQLDSAQNQVDGAEATLNLAKSAQLNIEIYEKAYQSTQRQMEQVQAAYKSALGQEKFAEASLQEANAVLKDATILAPTSGRVTLKMVDKGELVNEGTPIVEIIDLSKLDLTVYISEKQIGRVKLGQEARVYIDSLDNKEFIGQVSYISDKAEFTPKNVHMKEDRVKLVYGVKIRLEDANGIIKPGMPADAVIR